MPIKKLNPSKLQTLIIVNSSAYATHKPYNVENWLRVKKIFRTDSNAISALVKFDRLTPKNPGIAL